MSKVSFLLLAAALLASCTLATGHKNDPTEPSSIEIADFQRSFMSSYYAERTGAPSGMAGGPRALTPFSVQSRDSASKATVPLQKLTSVAFASLAPLSIPNYPEPGQTTSFTATKVSGTPAGTEVYDIVSTTAFPSGDLRASYVEEYYVQNVGLNSASTPWNTGTTPDLNWTAADPIVRKDSGGAWAADPVDGVNGYLIEDLSARVKMLLTFRDGSTRTETIVSSSLAGGAKFDPAAFDVAGSLDLSQAFVPAASSDPNVMYSSVVKYYVTPKTTYNFWFWAGSSQQTILGIRYYTEIATPPTGTGTYTAYTASFEKTLSTLTTTGGTFTSTLASVFSGSTFDTLAESVLRQQVVYKLGQTTGASPYFIPDPSSTGAITTNMKTRVVNIAGKKDFYLSQSNSDNVLLSSAGSTIYIPTGDADAILAGDSSLNVFTRDQQIKPATGTLPFAISLADYPGIGDLATLYTSITEGTAAATPIATAPANSSLTGGANSFTFVGQQAVGLQTTSALDLSSAGTVEAWVYLNAITDTAGIVHNGVKADFSDEGYSLQGWGNSGQVGIILDKMDPNASGAYDSVLSSTNLAKKKWYYIAATWDKATKKICLYINPTTTAPNATGTMNLTAAGVRYKTDQVILGSQLPTSYSSTYGYFGIDGRIVGANVTARALTAAEVLKNYNDYKGSTGTW
jgi:hypothetical protein